MRKEIRYRLDAPAVFSWEGAGHKRFQGEGITRDVSIQGAFILTATMPPPDCPIQLDLLLPSLTGMKSMMRITGRARVLRVEHPSIKYLDPRFCGRDRRSESMGSDANAGRI